MDFGPVKYERIGSGESRRYKVKPFTALSMTTERFLTLTAA